MANIISFDIPDAIIPTLKTLSTELAEWDKKEKGSAFHRKFNKHKLIHQKSAHNIPLFYWYILWSMSEGTHAIEYVEDDGFYSWSNHITDHLIEALERIVPVMTGVHRAFLLPYTPKVGSICYLTKEGTHFVFDLSRVEEYLTMDQIKVFMFYQDCCTFRIIASKDEATARQLIGGDGWTLSAAVAINQVITYDM